MKAVLIVPSGTAMGINAILIYRGEITEVTSTEIRFSIRRYVTDWSLNGVEESFELEEGERIVVLTHVAQSFPGGERDIEIAREEFFCSGADRAVLIPEELHLCFEDGVLKFQKEDPTVEIKSASSEPSQQQVATAPRSGDFAFDGFCG